MSHWLCVTYNIILDYPPTGSTAYVREMSTPPKLLRSMALLYLLLLNQGVFTNIRQLSRSHDHLPIAA